LAASAWRASVSGLTNFEEVFFAMVEYRLSCFERAEDELGCAGSLYLDVL
jgi:hypothetical protein